MDRHFMTHRAPGGGVLLLLICCLPACAHRYENTPIDLYDPGAGYRFNVEPTDNNTNSLFVCLTFSGGGMRAAALSYGVMKELSEMKITWPPGENSVRLLDEVDLISAVSGGAFTAAYYRLFGDRIFEDFQKKFLNRDVQGELTLSVFNPLNWFRLASWWFDRIDLAAEHFDRVIFEGKTFSDIDPSVPRPFVVINATNMSTGTQFSFTQDQFDLLGSDLGSYPVANAVAASSAVPVALSPVTLRNYPAPLGYHLPEWIRRELENPHDDLEQSHRARSLASYHLEKDDHPYIHLLDGAVSDNLGLGVVLDEFRQGFIQRLRHGTKVDKDSPIEKIQKLLVIIVNSRTKLDASIDQSSSAPGIINAAYYALVASIDQRSLAMLEVVKESLRTKRKAQAAFDDIQKLFKKFSSIPSLPTMQKFQVYLVEIDFDQITDTARREKFLKMPTNLALEPDQIEDLIAAGGELLRKNPEFRRFLADLTPNYTTNW